MDGKTKRRAAAFFFYIALSILAAVLVKAHWLVAFLFGPAFGMGLALDVTREGIHETDHSWMLLWVIIWMSGLWFFCHAFKSENGGGRSLAGLSVFWILSGLFNVACFAIGSV